MGLLRYQIFLSYGAIFVSLWIYLIINSSTSTSSNSVDNNNNNKLVLSNNTKIWYIPVMGVIMLGSYLLTLLIVGVATYKDCPEAAIEMENEIKEAQLEMKKRKVIT